LKICGITRLSEGISAFEQGADLVGVVRAPGSPRYASVDVIRKLSKKNVKLAGVYTRQEDIGSETDYLDYVQLHFRHDASTIQSIKEKHAVRVISVALSMDPVMEQRLVEYRDGGADVLLVEFASGFGAEIERARSLRQKIRFGVAGAIQYADLAGIKKLNFSMIDVSRSLEASPGIKDPEKMSRFIREALN
ncbi:N-(5'-phosphoribosyl)anthranilate isomerase, partial [mine drainage metagenome]